MAGAGLCSKSVLVVLFFLHSVTYEPSVPCSGFLNVSFRVMGGRRTKREGKDFFLEKAPAVKEMRGHG